MENNTPPKKLYRSAKDKMIGGVCGGLGEYFNIDSTIVRLAFILLGLCAGGLIAYIAALIIVPEAVSGKAEAIPSPPDPPNDDDPPTLL